MISSLKKYFSRAEAEAMIEVKFTKITIALVFPYLCEPTVGEGRSRVAMSESRPLICKKGTPMRSVTENREEKGVIAEFLE